ncbi:hypothetical protein HY58_07600 [Flavihumibacter sp. ZG627]|nr:hypothetical protein HY58_07600 [Flavihumibacter sp. ZG627]
MKEMVPVMISGRTEKEKRKVIIRITIMPDMKTAGTGVALVMAVTMIVVMIADTEKMTAAMNVEMMAGMSVVATVGLTSEQTAELTPVALFQAFSIKDLKLIRTPKQKAVSNE